MAAYAALLSLNITIERIPYPFPLVKFQIAYLAETCTFLLGFLERNSNNLRRSSSSGKEIRDLERKITDSCNDTEDLIETFGISQILAEAEKSSKNRQFKQSPEDMSMIFLKCLQKLRKEFEAIKKKAEQLDTTAITPSVPSKYAPTSSAGQDNNTMVGFEEHLEQVKKKIVSHQSKLQILPITGMGGIGKTTLARNVFDDQLIKDHFKIRLWITISQSYKMVDIFQSLLTQLEITDNADKTSEEHENDLGLKLYQSLIGWRYIVVLDDVWSGDVWEKMKTYFPDDNNHSRVIMTSRESKVASHAGSSKHLYELEPLDEKKSWDLLKQKVFPKGDCPSVLEDIGRDIAISCKGLPLALAVIGGQLVSNKSKESWLSVADDVNSVLHSEGDDDCVKILSLSYDNLPTELKPCFLFMGSFREDEEVRVSKLVKLWVAEGLVKPITGVSFDDTAMLYLTDLVERNLILIRKRGSRGKMVSCQIHDILRDVCLSEAYKQNFLCTKRSYDQHYKPPHMVPELRKNIKRERGDGSILYPSRLYTDVLDDNVGFITGWYMLMAVRYRTLTFSAECDFRNLISNLEDPLTITMWQNIQTLIISASWTNELVVLPPMVWDMPQVRHLQIERLVLPDPPTVESHVNGKGHNVLKNLHTLLNACNLKFSKEVLQRIPNVKKLKLTFTEEVPEGVGSLSDYYGIHNIDQLLKLQSLSCSIGANISLGHISFPSLLKKLTLDGGRIPWESMSMVGVLPNLEVLRLRNHAFCGAEWRPNDDEFGNLKSLHLQTICLEEWEVEESHFPSLESLILCDVWGMEEIPPSVGYVETLKLISLEFCSASLGMSAQELQQDQKDNGNDQIQVKIRLSNDAREKLWKLKKHFEETHESLSPELASEIQDLLDEAHGPIEAMVKYKHKKDLIILSNILEEIKAIYPVNLQDMYTEDDDISQVPSYANETHRQNIAAPSERQHHIVGFEDETKELIRNLKEVYHYGVAVSIVGLSSTGKTKLAEKIFHDPEIQFEFPVRIWVNCRWAYTIKSLYCEILKEFTVIDDMISLPEKELSQIVVAYLQTTRYLIVLDSIELFHGIVSDLQWFPHNGKLLVTANEKEEGRRFSRNTYKIRSMTSEESWLLLQLDVFGKAESPRELKDHGKLIADRCFGSPLATTVAAGILSSKVSSTEDLAFMTDTWKNMAKAVNKFQQRRSIESIIALSYDNLPYHLRACFLYLGMFPERYVISAWRLTQMWIAERFIQHEDGLSLEEIAENYLEQLISRNLVIVIKRGQEGKVKKCRICIEIRNFCKIKAADGQESFFTEIMKGTDILPNTYRVCFHQKAWGLNKINGCPLVRSFICLNDKKYEGTTTEFKLLRVFEVKMKLTNFMTSMFKLIHLSYIALSLSLVVLPREFSELWNLQTLIVDTEHRTLEVKADILRMKKLRHFKTNASANLPKPESDSTGVENIRTLGVVSPQSCIEDEFSYRTGNLKKLSIRGQIAMLLDSTNGSVDFLAKLKSLEELKLANDVFPLPPDEGKLQGLPLPYQFPPKLKSLTLTATFLDWTCMSVLGQLENLKLLKLKDEAFVGSTWDTVCGGFRELEALFINRTDLVTWTASKDHFPRLRSLELRNCEELIQIPIELADIPSFHRLLLYGTNSAVAAAKEIRSRKEDGQTSNDSGFDLSIFAQVCSRTLIDLDASLDSGEDVFSMFSEDTL